MPSPGTPLSPQLHVFTDLVAVPLGFMEASLHRHERLNHWPLVTEFNLQALCPPLIANPLITWLAPLACNQPILRCFPKVASLTQQKTPF